MLRHGISPHRAIARENVARSTFANPGVFGRMFPALPQYQFSDSMLTRLAEKMERDSQPDGGAENGAIPAGFTFLGQFIDHDITFDPTSSLERQNDPEAIHNFRTPLLELDSVYGAGPAATPYLYDQDVPPGRSPVKLLAGINEDNEPNDLPRNRQGLALIGDPRNDENLIISQLHLAFLKFHNKVVDHIKEHGVEEGFEVPADDDELVFREAQRVVRWHYQWIIVHEFLPHIIGQTMVDRILGDKPSEGALTVGQDPIGNVLDRFYFRWKEEPFIPVEFAVAAYRFGHSQVRAGYRLNVQNGFGALLFPEGAEDPNFAGDSLFTARNLTSNTRVLRRGRHIDNWGLFFGLDAVSAPQRSMAVNAELSPSLFRLPFGPRNIQSLALRNLQRGRAFSLPWGQRVANAMRAPLVPEESLGLRELGFPRGRAPLWYYVLKEAEVQAGGAHLGEVGGRIVGEVLLGLLLGDSKSYLTHDPLWTPFLPRKDQSSPNNTFTMADLLAFASPPTSPLSPSPVSPQPSPAPKWQ